MECCNISEIHIKYCEILGHFVKTGENGQTDVREKSCADMKFSFLKYS